MSKLEELHVTPVRKYGLNLNTSAESAKESADITTNVAVKFHEWVRKSKHIVDKQNGSYFFNNRYYITEELFEIFINNYYAHTT
jgi:hypothetical protein